MSSNSISALLMIVNKAKELGSYSVANLAFSCLIDIALDLEKELHFIWEKSPGNDDDDIYYDLLVISDGIRNTSIPAPLLKKPEVFRSLCKKEEEKEEHNRSIKQWILEIEFEEERLSLRQQIFSLFPNALELKEKYLVSSRKIHDEEKEFNRKVEVAKNTTFAKVEATGELRQIYISPTLGYSSFLEIPWDSHNYTIGGSINNPQWVVKSDGNPQWIWYYVHSQLATLKKGESRWLIGKGCDASSYYEIWIVTDPTATVKPLKKQEGDNDTFWLSNYEPSNNYRYTDTDRGNPPAIKFSDIKETADIIQHISDNTGDVYYDDRWLVWNRVAQRYDLLISAQY
jgi:hypothetical protein